MTGVHRRTRGWLVRTLLALAVGAALSQSASTFGVSTRPGKEGRARQRVTAERMHTLRMCIKIYLQRHGKHPETLALAVSDLYPSPPDHLLVDGWGRPMVYYACAAGYFLGSFGSDGLPDVGQANHESEDCDLVMISDVYARLPADVSP